MNTSSRAGQSIYYSFHDGAVRIHRTGITAHREDAHIDKGGGIETARCARRCTPTCTRAKGEVSRFATKGWVPSKRIKRLDGAVILFRELIVLIARENSGHGDQEDTTLARQTGSILAKQTVFKYDLLCPAHLHVRCIDLLLDTRILFICKGLRVLSDVETIDSVVKDVDRVYGSTISWENDIEARGSIESIRDVNGILIGRRHPTLGNVA